MKELSIRNVMFCKNNVIVIEFCVENLRIR
jgi:hypothetical protein